MPIFYRLHKQTQGPWNRTLCLVVALVSVCLPVFFLLSSCLCWFLGFVTTVHIDHGPPFFFLILWACMCVWCMHVYVCASVYLLTYTCAHMYKGPRSMLGILFFEAQSPTEPRARWFGCWAPRMPLCPQGSPPSWLLCGWQQLNSSLHECMQGLYWLSHLPQPCGTTINDFILT